MSTYCVLVTVLGSADKEVDLRGQVVASVDIIPIKKTKSFQIKDNQFVQIHVHLVSDAT